MNCHEVNEIAYFDQDLPEDSRLKIGDHLAACEKCALKVARLKKTEALLGAWKSVEPSPDFKKKFWSKVKENQQTLSWKERFSWSGLDLFAPASVFAAILIVVTSFLIRAPFQPQEQYQAVLSEKQAKSAEIVAWVDLLENQEMLMDTDLLLEMDLLLDINSSNLEKS